MSLHPMLMELFTSDLIVFVSFVVCIQLALPPVSYATSVDSAYQYLHILLVTNPFIK